MPSWVVPLIFLGFSASLSNFGGAVGLGVLPLTRGRRIEITLTFLIMEILMPILGIILGNRLAGGIGSKGEVVAGVVLLILCSHGTGVAPAQMPTANAEGANSPAAPDASNGRAWGAPRGETRKLRCRQPHARGDRASPRRDER